MGVSAPAGVTKAYYFAYPIGLLVSFGVYWLACWYSPPDLSYGLKEWKEVRDYVRPAERGGVFVRDDGDVESDSGSGSVVVREKEGKGIMSVGAVESI